MGALGLILLLVAALAWAGFLMQKFKGGRLEKAPFVKTGECSDSTAGDKGAISAEGKVAHKELLTSPVTHTECLFYDVKVTASWKSGENSRSLEVMHDKKAAEFSLDDGSGPVNVDVSKGGDLDYERTFNKKKGMGLKAVVTAADAIEFGDHNFAVRPGMKIKGTKIPMSADYTVVERIVKPAETLYVCGKWDGEAKLIGAPSWTSLIMSSKGREALVGATAKTRERAKMVGMITTPLAILFFILGAVFGGDSSDAGEATPANTDAVEAAATEKPADQPAAKPADKPAAKPAAKSAPKPAEAPAPTASGGAAEPAPAPAPAAGGGGGGSFKGKRR